jgi:hypothetical protein
MNLAGRAPSCTLNRVYLVEVFVNVSCVGSNRSRLGIWVLVAPLALACGAPAEQDFYEPPSKSGGGGSRPTSTALTLTATTASNTSAASNTTGGGGSSTSAGSVETTSDSSTSGGGTGGAEQTEAASSGGTAGTRAESCDELPSWDGGNPEFTLGEGDEVQHNGRRYRANEAITFPNPECAPDEHLDWCAGWFEDLGPC